MKSTSGLVMIVIAVAGLIFAWIKRPVSLRSDMSVIQMAIENPNAWVLKDGIFYGGVAVFAFLLIAGIMKIAKAGKSA